MPKRFGHQGVPSHPGAHRQDLDGQRTTHGLVENALRVFGRPGIGVFTIVHRRMEGKLTCPVHRGHEGPTLRVDRDMHPGLAMLKSLFKTGCTQVHGKHFAAHEVALDPGAAAPSNAQLVTNRAAGPVGPHQLAGSHRNRRTTGQWGHGGVNTLKVLHKMGERPAVTHIV